MEKGKYVVEGLLLFCISLVDSYSCIEAEKDILVTDLQRHSFSESEIDVDS